MDSATLVAVYAKPPANTDPERRHCLTSRHGDPIVARREVCVIPNAYPSNHALPRSYHYHASTREYPSVEPILQNGDKSTITGPVGSDQDLSGWAQGPLNLSVPGSS